MSAPEDRRFTTGDAEVILARAADLERAAAEPGGLTAGALERIGSEIGVSPWAIRRSLAEYDNRGARPSSLADRILGPASVTASVPTSRPVAEVSHDLDRSLRSRLLEPAPSAGASRRWAQRRGHWPDTGGGTAVTLIESDAVALDDSTAIVTIRAHVGDARLRYIEASGLGLVMTPLLALAAIAGPVAAIVALAASWLVIAAAAASYRQRLRTIERRLTDFVATVAAAPPPDAIAGVTAADRTARTRPEDLRP